MSLFERELSVSAEAIEFWLKAPGSTPWDSFVLNPRRLRGSDFLMRWTQGVWSEIRLIQAINATERFFALPYGPSSTAPSANVRDFELYFELLEQAGLADVKRPDLLIFRRRDRARVRSILTSIEEKRPSFEISTHDVHEHSAEVYLPFIPESDDRLQELLAMAVIGVECENSLWIAAQMPAYGTQLRPMRRLNRALGLPKNAVLPTVIIKEEDRQPLLIWERSRKLPIHVWHVFYDIAFGLALGEAERLIEEGVIEASKQIYQAPGGATTEKSIYKIFYHYAYELALSIGEPALVADRIIDKNGHILPYVRFEGGRLEISQHALSVLDRAAADRLGSVEGDG
jgi:hypothetical protein